MRFIHPTHLLDYLVDYPGLTKNLRPLSGRVKYAQYFDGIVANPIGQDVGQV